MANNTKKKKNKKLIKNNCKKYKNNNIKTTNNYNINVYNAPPPKESVIKKIINTLIYLIKRIIH